MQKHIVTLSLFVALLFLGCASHPKKIEAAYVSSYQYRGYSEHQIAMEMEHINERVISLYDDLEAEAAADQIQMGVGLVLFWPTLFLLEGGDGPQAAEYSRLKGEYEALRKIAVEKSYDLAALPLSPEESIKAAIEAKREERKAAPKSSTKRAG